MGRPFVKGDPRIARKGKTPEHELSSERQPELEAMEWVYSHPESADVSWQQENLRKFMGQNQRAFMERLWMLQGEREESTDRNQSVQVDEGTERALRVARNWLEAHSPEPTAAHRGHPSDATRLSCMACRGRFCARW
jgi:hypothetical protein